MTLRLYIHIHSYKYNIIQNHAFSIYVYEGEVPNKTFDTGNQTGDKDCELNLSMMEQKNPSYIPLEVMQFEKVLQLETHNYININ